MKTSSVDNFIGCIIGGAIGDAMGAPIEFYSLNQIISRYGLNGVNNFVEDKNGIGYITDDTQMLLFTAEGIIRNKIWSTKLERDAQNGHVEHVYNSYLSWLFTQNQLSNKNIYACYPDLNGWLLQNKKMHTRRAPGTTCLDALCSGKYGTTVNHINESKGCGGIMRVAPVGLLIGDEFSAFKIGAEIAAITHGHPSGYLSAGSLACIISLICGGYNLENSIQKTIQILTQWENHEETLNAILAAIRLNATSDSTFADVERLGGGWVGEQALSIALFCSLKHTGDFQRAVSLAINHSGDSDSTGSITGNIVGLINGIHSIPKHLVDNLEMNEVFEQVAIDLFISRKKDSKFINHMDDLLRRYTVYPIDFRTNNLSDFEVAYKKYYGAFIFSTRMLGMYEKNVNMNPISEGEFYKKLFTDKDFAQKYGYNQDTDSFSWAS